MNPKTPSVLAGAMLIACTQFVTPAHAETDDRFSFRVNPLPLLVGGVYLEALYKINDQWAAGPVVSYIDFTIDDNHMKMFGTGVRADWFQNGAFSDGLIGTVGIGFGSGEMSLKESNKIYDGSGSGVSLMAMGGYNWRWDKITLNLQAGYSYSIPGSLELKASDGSKKSQSLSGVAFDFSVGWVF